MNNIQLEEENFEELVKDFLNEDAIMEKIQLDIEEEQEKEEIEKDLKHNLEPYAISVDEFLINYLRINDDFLSGNLTEDSMYAMFRTKQLTHKDLKILTRDNPFVIGVCNADVDVDDIKKGDCVVVRDCNGNLGTYLNPSFFRDLSRIEDVKRQLKIISKIRIKNMSQIMELYHKNTEAKDLLVYLLRREKQYIELLEKLNKPNGFSRIKRFVKKFNNKGRD